MKVELKNVKFSEFNSQETNCFQANVYIDGKKAGTVSNGGHGGPDEFSPWSLATTLNEYAKTLPKYEFMGKMNEHNAETFIGDLFNAYQEEKLLKSLLKSKFVYTIHSEHGIYSSKANKSTSVKELCDKCTTEELVAKLTNGLGAKQVLNLMPYDEALALFKLNMAPPAPTPKAEYIHDPAFAF